jgi:hypothetical protein
MKSLARTLFAALLLASVAHAEVPSLISSGFDAYKASGSKGALAVWLRGVAQPVGKFDLSGLPVTANPGSETPDEWGPMESYEILAVFSPTSRLRRVYAVAYFPQGPLFCSFDLYKASGAWTTYGLKFSQRPDDVLPVDVIEKTG